MIKKAVRQTQQMRQAGIVQQPGPIHISNVKLLEAKAKAANPSSTDLTASRL